jgi:hypothetical protein
MRKMLLSDLFLMLARRVGVAFRRVADGTFEIVITVFRSVQQ